jgi:hypothetical protein
MVSDSLSEKSGASSITRKSSSRSTVHQRREPGAGCIVLVFRTAPVARAVWKTMSGCRHARLKYAFYERTSPLIRIILNYIKKTEYDRRDHGDGKQMPVLGQRAITNES